MSETGAHLLLISSSAVYGSGGGRAIIDEGTPRQPVNQYGRAKAAAEDLAKTYERARMPLRIVRLFSLMGPRIQSARS